MSSYIMLESVDQLTEEVVLNLIRNHKANELPRIKRLRKYYEGKHDILNRTFADSSKPNNKIVCGYPHLISDVTTGYFIGNPVKYTGTDDKALMYLLDVLNYNDEGAVNSIVAKNASIFGVGYELIFLDGNSDIRFAPIDNEEVIMIYSTSVIPEPIGAIRYYTIKSYVDGIDDVEKVEVYTSKEVKYYTNIASKLRLDIETTHFFGQVPIIAYDNNDEEIGDFEQVIPLIDAYNKAVSDQCNDFDYYNDCYMIIRGAEDTDEEVFNSMKQNRLMLLSENASAEFLVKQADNATIESYKNRLQQDIHKFSYVPDISSEQFNAQISGVALAYKFTSLEQACNNKERLFRRALIKRAEMIFQILGIKGINLDATTIEPVFSRNLPSNTSEYVTMAKELYGLVSKETLLAQLPFVDDVQAELERIEKQDDPYSDGLNNVFSFEDEIL